MVMVLLYDTLWILIHPNYKLVEPFNFILYVSASLAIIGATIGMFGSYRAVRRYLKNMIKKIMKEHLSF